MNKRVCLLSLSLFVLGMGLGLKQVSSETSVRSEDLTGVIEFIRNKSKTINTYVVDTQDFHIGLLRSTGRLYFKDPFFVRWEDYSTQNELESICIVNDKGTSFYFPDSNELHRIRHGWKSKDDFRPLSPVLGIYAKGEELRLIGQKKFKGSSCYVIEVADKTSPNRNLWSIQQVYFDRVTGLIARMVSVDWRGEVLSETVFTNYQLNVPIEDNKFSFSPPPNVEIVEGNIPSK